MPAVIDNSSSRQARLYIAAIAVLAAALFLLARGGGSRSLLPPGSAFTLIVPLFVLASVVAQRFRLHLTFQTKVNMEGAVFVAASLLLDVPTAIAVATTSSLISSLIEWDSWDETIFNTAQAALSVGAAGAAFHALRHVPGAPEVPGLGSLLAVVAGGLTLLLVNTWTVATVSALDVGSPPLRSWLRSLWLDTPESAALVVVGVVVAAVILEHPWLIPVLVVPIALIHHSLRRSIETRVATRAAVDELALIVERRDPFMAGHAERVAAHVHAFGSRLGLSTRDLDIVTAAAQVHDVGMVAIDPRVLAKPGALSAAEWDEVKRHPVVGADLLARFPHFAIAARAIRHHHERWDGTGYPDGLAGEAIPFAARLIAVFDAFDAMTHHRPHRPALGAATALTELERGAGHRWDPTIVAAFAAHLRAEQAMPRQPEGAQVSQRRPASAPATFPAPATAE